MAISLIHPQITQITQITQIDVLNLNAELGTQTFLFTHIFSTPIRSSEQAPDYPGD